MSFSFALSASAVYTWYGNVSIGTNVSTNGAKVSAYIGGSSTPVSGTPMEVGGPFGVPDSGYQVDLACSSGDTVFLKVWGINASPVICNVGPATGNTTNLSVSLVASGGACKYSAACTTAVCCSGATEVNDGTTSGATCSATCSAGTTTTTTGGTSSTTSGGGGGGGISLGSETSVPFTAKGRITKTLKFTKTFKISVSEIKLLTKAGASIANGKVSVQETTVGSEISSSIVNGKTKVYKYLSITTQNILDSDVDNALITFEVPSSWLNANDMDVTTVKLNRLVSNVWTVLDTKRVSSTSTAYVYEATTPGFSIFAISADKKVTDLSAFELIDIIESFYAGTSSYTAFEIIDLIEDFYA